MANFSKRSEEITRVMREVKDKICQYEFGVDKEMFKEIVNQSIKDTANELELKESTIMDKLTRQLNKSKEEFVNELWDFFIDKCNAEDTRLGNCILFNRTSKDDSKNITSILDSIKNY